MKIGGVDIRKALYDHRGLGLLAGGIGVLVFSIFVTKIAADSAAFPTQIEETFAFAQWVNAGEGWLKENVRWFTKIIANFISATLEEVELILLLSPWPVIMLAIVLPGLAFGGLRLALFCLLAMTFWHSMDMWDSAMETLALMTVAVVISIILGVSLGVVASQSNRVEAVVRPVLDTMQTMPSFVYLIPAIFFFGIGGAPAIMATIIYAIPPAVRLTNLGIRQVSPEIIEATHSFGSTPLQMLVKVKIPLALPSIMMGINQTVMMALGLVVIATFIGAGGLGYEVWQALRHLNVGWSLEGGLSIVLMAIMFDRISYAMSGERASRALPGDFRLLPKSLDGAPWAQAFERGLGLIVALFAAISHRYALAIAGLVSFVTGLFSRSIVDDVHSAIVRHAFFFAGLTIVVGAYLFDKYLVGFGSFPDALTFTLRGPVDDFVDALVINKTFIALTTAIRIVVYQWLLSPLGDFLVALPWWYSMALVTSFVWITAGRTLGITTIVAMMFIGATGLWSIAMTTLASILVSVMLCLIIGVPLGILAAVSDTFDTFMKPLLDAMQTMPAFVYLIPVLMFFGGNAVSAVIATLIYAIPPMIRLTTLGIREVPGSAVEAAGSFGSTFLQMLLKVKMPLALPSIMMGLNQAVMMALAMQILTPLIGGGGLGREVFNALAIVDTGKGLEAGLSIVFLAIVMDRLTQAWSKKKQAALGLE